MFCYGLVPVDFTCILESQGYFTGNPLEWDTDSTLIWKWIQMAQGRSYDCHIASEQGSFCVCAQPMRDNITMWHRLIGWVHAQNPGHKTIPEWGNMRNIVK